MKRPDFTTRHRIVPAAYVIFEKDGQILLTRRFNTGYMDGKYSLPSGHIEAGESASATAVREAKEEVGVTLRAQDLRPVHVVHRQSEEGDHERVDFYFRAMAWEGEPHNTEPHKCDEVRWFDIADLPDNVVPTVRAVLEKIPANEFYSEQF